MTTAGHDHDGESLAEKMQATMDRLPPEGVTLVEIRDLIGREGMMLLTAFLTIIFLVPVSIPGVSTVFGGAILLLSFSRLFNRPVWLPDRLKRRPVSSQKLRAGMQRGMKWFHRLERISRPRRLRSLTTGGLAGVINNLALILGAVLLMAPFGLIPFSNTLPAIAILFFAIGLLQRDGVCILLGHLMNVATIVYFGVLIGGGAVAIQKLFERIF
ncbi:MAG TPA: exopolysaccharide biosynthesis protein [Thermoanaerobaculia bacterium]|nr:exopolysaccharide biosynthesis protein [Thermoanaerobaculia bacterium]